MPTPPKETELTKSLSRALRILNTLAEAGRPLGVTEIARRIGVHKSSVYRLVRTMVEFNYLEQHEATAEYWLGTQLSRLGQLAGAHLELPRLARAHVEQLAQKTRETANLLKLDGDSCLYLISVQTEHSIGMLPRPTGSTDALYCTAAGKAMLAFMPPRRAESLLTRIELIPRTARTLSTPEAVLASLEAVRQRGYAVDDEENEENVRCVGSPIFDRRGDVVGAVSISGPVFRFTDAFIAAAGPLVIECAVNIAAAMGLPPAQNPLSALLAPPGGR